MSLWGTSAVRSAKRPALRNIPAAKEVARRWPDFRSVPVTTSVPLPLLPYPNNNSAGVKLVVVFVVAVGMIVAIKTVQTSLRMVLGSVLIVFKALFYVNADIHALNPYISCFNK